MHDEISYDLAQSLLLLSRNVIHHMDGVTEEMRRRTGYGEECLMHKVSEIYSRRFRDC